MKKQKTCPFCKAVELQRKLENLLEFETVLSAALVSHVIVNGERRGRTTDFMQSGKGYPLRFCPSCGKPLMEVTGR